MSEQNVVMFSFILFYWKYFVLCQANVWRHLVSSFVILHFTILVERGRRKVKFYVFKTLNFKLFYVSDDLACSDEENEWSLVPLKT
jgi:hypothetical protein